MHAVTRVCGTHRITYHSEAASLITYLPNKLIYDIMQEKEGAFMTENKLLDLSFQFAVAIVNLVDGVTAPKSSYMTDQPLFLSKPQA